MNKPFTLLTLCVGNTLPLLAQSVENEPEITLNLLIFIVVISLLGMGIIWMIQNRRMKKSLAQQEKELRAEMEKDKKGIYARFQEQLFEIVKLHNITQGDESLHAQPVEVVSLFNQYVTTYQKEIKDKNLELVFQPALRFCTVWYNKRQLSVMMDHMLRYLLYNTDSLLKVFIDVRKNHKGDRILTISAALPHAHGLTKGQMELHIAKKIIELHKGSLHIEYKENSQIFFTVRFYPDEILPDEEPKLIPLTETILKSQSQLATKNPARKESRRATPTERKNKAIVSTNERLLKSATDFVNKNMENQALSVEEMSKKLGLSRTHMHRKLKSLTGQSPVEFIKSIRMNKAADLLRTGKLSVSEVAYKVGYNSPSYFSSSFTAHFGISPSQYMENGKNS